MNKKDIDQEYKDYVLKKIEKAKNCKVIYTEEEFLEKMNKLMEKHEKLGQKAI